MCNVLLMNFSKDTIALNERLPVFVYIDEEQEF